MTNPRLMIMILCQVCPVRLVGVKPSNDVAFIAASGRTMPGGFTECNLRNNGMHLGIIVFMSDSPESRMDLLTRKQNPGFGFAGNEAKFNKTGRIAMQVAAAFHNLDGRIEGVLVELGVVQNRFLSEDSGSALLVIDGNGKPAIRNIREFLSSNSKKLGFFDEAEKKKWSVFQQRLVIDGGKAADVSKFKFKDSSFYCLRFLVEMQNKDGSSSYGIISFEKKISLEDAMKFMLNLKQGAGGKPARIKNAVYLDSGSVGKGFVYYGDGAKRLTGMGDFGDERFSNMIILHSEQGKNGGFFEPAKK